jgi:hypothetical protein
MISGLAKMAAPEDLRTTAGAPRPKSLRWRPGDPVTTDGVRWVIRILTPERVELEAMNARCGMWWTTTPDKLPEKTGR